MSVSIQDDTALHIFLCGLFKVSTVTTKFIWSQPHYLSDGFPAFKISASHTGENVDVGLLGCYAVGRYQRFRGTYRFHLQGRNEDGGGIFL
jgi:hypothetical protein